MDAEYCIQVSHRRVNPYTKRIEQHRIEKCEQRQATTQKTGINSRDDMPSSTASFFYKPTQNPEVLYAQSNYRSDANFFKIYLHSTSSQCLENEGTLHRFKSHSYLPNSKLIYNGKSNRALQLQDEKFIMTENVPDSIPPGKNMSVNYPNIYENERSPARHILINLREQQYWLRVMQFKAIQERSGRNKQVPKTEVIRYFFDEPVIMKLYRINPLSVAQEVKQFRTDQPQLMSFLQFSCFLLIKRQDRFGAYTVDKIEQARRSLEECESELQSKFIATQETANLLDTLFRKLLGGGNEVYTEELVIGLKQLCEPKGMLDQDIIFITNIQKNIPMHQLIYEIENQVYANMDNSAISESRLMNCRQPSWTFEEWQIYLYNYRPLKTRDKYELIIEKGNNLQTGQGFKVCPTVLNVLRNVYYATPKVANYFVKKFDFLRNVERNPEWPKIRDQLVRLMQFKDVCKEDVEDSLIRMHYESLEYTTLDQTYDYLSIKGRPRVIDHLINVQNSKT